MLYPGTLNRHQGLDVAIRAFAKIAPRSRTAVFHIHGEGRSQDVLIKLVEDLGLQEPGIVQADAADPADRAGNGECRFGGGTEEEGFLRE